MLDCTTRFMNIYLLLYILAPIAFLLVIVLVFVLPRRIQMERRARALLAQHPHAERTSVYLALHSTWAGQKQREIDAKIEEMKAQGWTFLRGIEANPLRTICSWGGGLTLHFVRTHDSETRHAA